MFTENGFSMASGITLCVMAIISLMIGFRQYRQKGRLFSITAFLAGSELEEKLRTKKIYRGVAWGYILVGLIMLFMGLAFILGQEGFAHIAAATAFGQMCAGFMRFFFGER